MYVPHVQVLFAQKQKFIVVSAQTEDGLADLLLGDPAAEWHKDIYDDIAAQYPVRGVYGGGRIFIDPEQKKIYLWGTSDRFGPAPRYLVEEILEGEFPDYSLAFSQEPA